MNKHVIISKAMARSVRASRIAQASFDDILQQAIDMTPEEREAVVSNFLKEHGLKGAINLIAKVGSMFKSFDPAPVATDTNISTAQLYEGFKKPREEPNERTIAPGTGDIKTILTKIGDWMVPLTAFCVLLSVGTMDYSDKVLKHSDSANELKAWMITFGAAFMTWAVKKLASKWKTK